MVWSGFDPPPSDQTLAAIYGQHYYDAWGLDHDAETVGRLKRKTFGFLFDRLPSLQRGSKVLDCGAATGFLLDVAKERGFEPYGVELSEFGAQSIAKKFGADRAFCGEIEAAQFPTAPPGDFDVITMCDYIEHVRDPSRVLARAHTLLKPGGLLALTTPDTGSVTHRLLGAGWSHYKLEHLYYFNRTNLGSLLARAGFDGIVAHPFVKALSPRYIGEQFERYPHPVLSRAARMMRGILPSRVQDSPLRLPTGEFLAIARRAG